MLRGYGPVILEAVSKTEPKTATQIHAGLIERAVCRAPGRSTVNRHLSELVAMGCVQQEAGGYRRLVDSEFDLPLEASA
jgi:hypothetical protein